MRARLACLSLLVLAGLVPGACASNRRGSPEDWPRRVVVFCPPERRSDADALAQTLGAAGDYPTSIAVTTIRRTRSSAAVYGLRRNPDRVQDLTELLKSVGEDVEILPFQQEGSGGNAVVVWLAPKAN